jgi:hypothetical protein
LPDSVREYAIDQVEDITLTWLDASIFADDDLRSLFTEQEFSDLAAKFKTEWIDDLEDIVSRWRYDYGFSEEVSLYEDLRENLERAAGFFSRRP